MKGFETCITRLQTQCYAVISVFVYMRDKFGEQYGWGVAEYSTPEVLFGADFTQNVYLHSPDESYEMLLGHMKELFPRADGKVLKKFLG